MTSRYRNVKLRYTIELDVHMEYPGMTDEEIVQQEKANLTEMGLDSILSVAEDLEVTIVVEDVNE